MLLKETAETGSVMALTLFLTVSVVVASVWPLCLAWHHHSHHDLNFVACAQSSHCPPHFKSL